MVSKKSENSAYILFVYLCLLVPLWLQDIFLPTKTQGHEENAYFATDTRALLPMISIIFIIFVNMYYLLILNVILVYIKSAE
jgi:hypothetical protein